MRRTYTHAEDTAGGKVHDAFYRGLRAAEDATGLTIASTRGKPTKRNAA